MVRFSVDNGRGTEIGGKDKNARYGQHFNHIQNGGRMKLVYMTEILNINYVFY